METPAVIQKIALVAPDQRQSIEELPSVIAKGVDVGTDDGGMSVQAGLTLADRQTAKRLGV